MAGVPILPCLPTRERSRVATRAPGAMPVWRSAIRRPCDWSSITRRPAPSNLGSRLTRPQLRAELMFCAPHRPKRSAREPGGVRSTNLRDFRCRDRRRYRMAPRNSPPIVRSARDRAGPQETGSSAAPPSCPRHRDRPHSTLAALSRDTLRARAAKTGVLAQATRRGCTARMNELDGTSATRARAAEGGAGSD
jgi:hypothetical protein